MITIDKINEHYVIAKFTLAVKKLNILVADKTKKLLQEVLDEGLPYFILDLENVLYIDSSGFSTIISLFNYAKNREIRFILCNVSESNMALIKITKLDNVLEISPNLETAIESIN